MALFGRSTQDFFDSKLRTVLALIAYVVMCRYRLVIELMGLWVVIAAGRFWTASPPPETPEGTRKLRRLNAFAEWLASPRQTRFFLRAVHIAAALSLTKVIFRLCDASQEVLLSTAYGGCLYGGVYCILIHGLAVHFSLPQWIYDPIGEVLAVAPAEQAAPPLPPPPTPAVESSPVRSVSFAEQPAPPPAQPQPTALTLPPAVPNYPAPIVKALELENSSGWKLVSDKDGVTFEKKPVSWAPQQACRFVIYMRAPLQFIAEFMNDRTKATEYDDLLEVTEEVEVLQPDGVVIYTSFRTPVAGVGKRDFLSEFRSVTISEDEWIQAAVNATHPRKPEQKGYVRGKIHLYSLMLKQFPDGRCRYKMLLSVDPRGWLPASAVDITNSKQIDKLKLLKRLIEGAYAASQAGQ